MGMSAAASEDANPMAQPAAKMSAGTEYWQEFLIFILILHPQIGL